ncbi:hypothetical protein C8Q76DRAFT_762049 [Earliella scabrosa]|nr:hypothetical protein C8Q76DRAFT_762049 [Earliella scabrosa]
MDTSPIIIRRHVVYSELANDLEEELPGAAGSGWSSTGIQLLLDCIAILSTNRTGRLGLDLDVLLMIQALADRQTVSRMMQTCRALHKAGERILLRDVTLSSGPSTDSFARFMLVEGTNRLPLLHCLTLTGTDPGGDSLKNLFLRLRLQPTFTSLTLHHPEQMLSTSIGLGSAIAALTSITNLAVLDTGTHTLAMLRAMCSKVVTARISTQEGGYWNMLALCDITQTLPCSRSSLETLRASWPARPGPYDDAQPLATRPCYPRLRSLVLESPFPPVTMDYSRAYPNLASLAIYGIHDMFEFHGHRRRNREQQEQELTWSWRSLREFRGSILVLYVLGLTCHVRRICVDDFDHQPNGVLLQTVLSDTRPSHLELRLLGAHSLRKSYCPVFKHDSTHCLKSFTLIVKLVCEDVEMDLEVFLKSIRIMAKALVVSTFELHIDCSRTTVRTSCHHPNVRLCPADGYRRSAANYRYPVESQIEALDVERAAAGIRRKAPFIQRVVVRVSNLHMRQDVIVSLGEPVDYSDVENEEHEL